MKKYELMVMDWVYSPTPTTPKAIQIMYGWQIEEYETQGFEPIPLTPEIPEKNGFVLKPDGWLWCKEKGIEDKNYIFIQFRKNCEEVRLIELNFINKVLAKYEHMHYVHELQHALRLCGIEKEIVL